MKQCVRSILSLILMFSLLTAIVPIAFADAPITEPQAIADYLFEYGKLPDNFITKKEAQNLGWDSSRNYLSDVAPGKSIGGDRFGNYEGVLPAAKGRQYYECDCYYTGGKRSAYRVVYSNDGLVYYTEDHYNTFTQLFPSKKSEEAVGTVESAVLIIEAQDIVNYLAKHGTLPDNFITKKEAQNLGWDSSKNYLSDVAPGKSIGGDGFGNREKLLPTQKGRKYYECDTGYISGKRPKARLVYSNDGLYFYTEGSKMYEEFTQLYPEE